MDKDMTVTEAAAIVSVHPETLRRLVREGKLEAYQVNPGARRPDYRITPASLQAYRAQKRSASGSNFSADTRAEYHTEENETEGKEAGIP